MTRENKEERKSKYGASSYTLTVGDITLIMENNTMAFQSHTGRLEAELSSNCNGSQLCLRVFPPR